MSEKTNINHKKKNPSSLYTPSTSKSEKSSCSQLELNSNSKESLKFPKKENYTNFELSSLKCGKKNSDFSSLNNQLSNFQANYSELIKVLEDKSKIKNTN